MRDPQEEEGCDFRASIRLLKHVIRTRQMQEQQQLQVVHNHPSPRDRPSRSVYFTRMLTPLQDLPVQLGSSVVVVAPQISTATTTEMVTHINESGPTTVANLCDLSPPSLSPWLQQRVWQLCGSFVLQTAPTSSAAAGGVGGPRSGKADDLGGRFPFMVDDDDVHSCATLDMRWIAEEEVGGFRRQRQRRLGGRGDKRDVAVDSWLRQRAGEDTGNKSGAAGGSCEQLLNDAQTSPGRAASHRHNRVDTAATAAGSDVVTEEVDETCTNTDSASVRTGYGGVVRSGTPPGSPSSSSASPQRDRQRSTLQPSWRRAALPSLQQPFFSVFPQLTRPLPPVPLEMISDELGHHHRHAHSRNEQSSGFSSTAAASSFTQGKLGVSPPSTASSCSTLDELASTTADRPSMGPKHVDKAPTIRNSTRDTRREWVCTTMSISPTTAGPTAASSPSQDRWMAIGTLSGSVLLIPLGGRGGGSGASNSRRDCNDNDSALSRTQNDRLLISGDAEEEEEDAAASPGFGGSSSSRSYKKAPIVWSGHAGRVCDLGWIQQPIGPSAATSTRLLLFSLHEDAFAVVWDVSQRKKLRQITLHSTPKSAAFLPMTGGAALAVVHTKWLPLLLPKKANSGAHPLTATTSGGSNVGLSSTSSGSGASSVPSSLSVPIPSTPIASLVQDLSFHSRSTNVGVLYWAHDQVGTLDLSAALVTQLCVVSESDVVVADVRGGLRWSRLSWRPCAAGAGEKKSSTQPTNSSKLTERPRRIARWDLPNETWRGMSTRRHTVVDVKCISLRFNKTTATAGPVGGDSSCLLGYCVSLTEVRSAVSASSSVTSPLGSGQQPLTSSAQATEASLGAALVLRVFGMYDLVTKGSSSTVSSTGPTAKVFATAVLDSFLQRENTCGKLILLHCLQVRAPLHRPVVSAVEQEREPSSCLPQAVSLTVSHATTVLRGCGSTPTATSNTDNRKPLEGGGDSSWTFANIVLVFRNQLHGRQDHPKPCWDDRHQVAVLYRMEHGPMETKPLSQLLSLPQKQHSPFERGAGQSSSMFFPKQQQSSAGTCCRLSDGQPLGVPSTWLYDPKGGPWAVAGAAWDDINSFANEYILKVSSCAGGQQQATRTKYSQKPQQLWVLTTAGALLCWTEVPQRTVGGGGGERRQRTMVDNATADDDDETATALTMEDLEDIGGGIGGEDGSSGRFAINDEQAEIVRRQWNGVNVGAPTLSMICERAPLRSAAGSELVDSSLCSGVS